MRDETFEAFADDEVWVLEEPRDLSERTLEFGLRIIRLYRSLPSSVDAQVIGKQLLRSGTSVGANFRETKRAYSNAEFLSKLGICLKECDETLCWIELLEKAEMFPSSKLADLKDEADQLIAIFTTISKRIKAKSGK